MKNRLNIYSNSRIKNFLQKYLFEYELCFMELNEIRYNSKSNQAAIIIILNKKDSELVSFRNLDESYLILSSLKNIININNNLEIVNTPISFNHIKNKIENFVQNLKVEFFDIILQNDKLINLSNNSFCYLTKIELEILGYLIKEKTTTKNFIKENVLNIKSSIDTNSLESHLTRIRKKMKTVKTSVKIHTKNDKLLITT
tara:strand:- start:1615 stop:2214 length:600 start_codon:yes stop_codon:yes gene_type:complete